MENPEFNVEKAVLWLLKLTTKNKRTILTRFRGESLYREGDKVFLNGFQGFKNMKTKEVERHWKEFIEDRGYRYSSLQTAYEELRRMAAQDE